MYYKQPSISQLKNRVKYKGSNKTFLSNRGNEPGFLRKSRGVSGESSNMYWSDGLAIIYCNSEPITDFSVPHLILRKETFTIYFVPEAMLGTYKDLLPALKEFIVS